MTEIVLEKKRLLWNQPGVPHINWVCLDMEDVEDDYEKCEMCGNYPIRYVHLMEHQDYFSSLRVGCICAGKMEGSSKQAKKREKQFKQELMIRSLRQLWKQSSSNQRPLIEQYVKYFQNQNPPGFSPNQLIFLITQLKYQQIRFDPSWFSLRIRKAFEKEQLFRMPSWKIQRLWSCLTSSQKQLIQNNIKLK